MLLLSWSGAAVLGKKNPSHTTSLQLRNKDKSMTTTTLARSVLFQVFVCHILGGRQGRQQRVLVLRTPGMLGRGEAETMSLASMSQACCVTPRGRKTAAGHRQEHCSFSLRQFHCLSLSSVPKAL